MRRLRAHYNRSMSVKGLGEMLETDVSLDLFSLRNGLDRVMQEKEPESAQNQELPMQVEQFPSDLVVSLFSDSFELEPLKPDEKMLTNDIPATEDSLMASFNFTSEFMDLYPTGLPDPLAVLPEVTATGTVCSAGSFKTESCSPLYVSPPISLPTSDHKSVTMACPVTPTSGPTPVITPINSLPSSPSGSWYSGYSSGWGPPSPTGKDMHRKKRGTGRSRSKRASATVSAVAQTYTAITPVVSPSSPVSPSPANCKHSAKESPDAARGDAEPDAKLPRHKRPSHIRAEHKRRNKIQNGLEDLKLMIPSVAEVFQNGGKDSKAAVLGKAVEHCRHIRTETKEQAREIQKLKAELESLTVSINEYQKLLPEEGAEVEPARPSQDIKQMFRDYVSSRTFGNWKFWIFGMLIGPLFESYNNSVVTKDRVQFCSSVIAWLDKSCSLVALRPVVFKALRNLSTKTSVMSTPEKLRQEAIDDVMQANFSAKLDSL